MDGLRFFKHLLAGRWQVARSFPRDSMARIESAIRQSESCHLGELRFAVEAGLDWPELRAGLSSRQRAVQVFSDLRVWDTEHNSGVLIYLLLADRKVEIVADRGIHARVGEKCWQSICHEMEQRFHAGEFENGVLQGLTAITALLKTHFPALGNNPDELPNHPVTL
ncbi:MAG: TPM domain-containing protein [Nitrosomonadales bacterium]|nr:TPM domain-containing protein [Nitrosomonadales bacterium]